jgi:multidrug efflux pump subunit AcrB
VTRIIAWFAGHGVAANVLMAALVIGGLASVFTLQREIFPETSPDIVRVSVPYPGAAPEEVEQGIVLRVEEAVQDIAGVKEIRSAAAEGRGTVTVELTRGADAQRVLDDVKSRVDAITSFPEEAEEPVVEQPVIRSEVLTVAVSGQAEERTLRRLAEQVRDDLLAMQGITQVELAAVRPYEVSIEVSQQALRRYGLSFEQVAQAVREASLRLPGGTVETRGGEILLRVEEQAYTGEQFERLPLLTTPDGARLAIGDVATVRDAFADTAQAARFNGEPAALVRIFRVGDQDAIDIAAKVKAYVTQAGAALPEGIRLTPWLDMSRVLEGRIDLLVENGLWGFALVFLVLALFLRLSLAAWVAAGIPISFLGTALLMPAFGLSVNMMSMFAFIVVLGIVVDDAIVVGESIYSRFQAGTHGVEGALQGAGAVSTPVIFAVLTTMAAFLPLLFLPGVFGQFMWPIPVIVVATLTFSLLESLLVLPHHLSVLKPPAAGRTARWRRFQESFGRGLERFARQRYAPAVEWAIEWRGLVLALGLAALAIAFAFAAGGWVQFRFFPPVESDHVTAALTMPQGTPEAQTTRAVRRLEQAALDLGAELEREAGTPVIRYVLASVGEQPFAAQQGGGAGARLFSGAHLGEVAIELVPSEAREITSQAVAERWRTVVGAIPGAEELTYTGSIFRAGSPINVRLAGADLESLRAIGEALKMRLRDYPGVYDIADSYRAGKTQIELDITERAQAAGLTLSALARQVRGAFYGEEAQRIQRGRDEIKVMVRLPEAERRSLQELEELRIRGPEGVSMPLSEAAVMRTSRSPSVIERVQRSQVLSVTADVDPQRASAGQILADLQQNVLPQLLRDHPRVRYELAGEQEEQRETLGGLARGFLFALLAIYVLLAIPFRSYMQPLLVMAAIPFGFVGALLGHLLMGLDFTILSMFGMVALTGVVINDSLVLVDYVNRRYRGGLPLAEAIREGGQARFRPVLLTSLTTFAGLAPLLTEGSVQAQFLIPMAASLAFGVLFATLITLFLVPVGYALLDDGRRLLGNRRPEAAASPGAE